MEICFKTPPPSQSVEEEEMLMDYDADSNRFLHGGRLSVFGCLLCLVKHKENAVSVCMYWLRCAMLFTQDNLLLLCGFIHQITQVDIARSDPVIHALIIVSKMHNSPSHPRAIAILAHLTQSPENNNHLVFKYTELLLTLQNATNSHYDKAWKYVAQHKPQHGQVVTRSHCTHSQNDCESHGTVQKRQKWGGIGSRGLDSKSVGRTGQSH